MYIVRSHRDNSEAYETQLEISLTSAGHATLTFSGAEFDVDGEQYDLDYDEYTPEQAIAKILTMIQEADINDMGPHVSQTMKTIWSSYLKQPPETGPGFQLAS